jgi:dihydroxyacetone kinase-like protein
MTQLNVIDVRAIIRNLKIKMDEKRDYLIELDGAMGDGDLGITMSKAFTAANEEAERSEEILPGKLLIKLGMAMAKAAPSTMGTLMATGFMRGGKAIGDTEALGTGELAGFMDAFVNGIMERGKSKPGNKTIIDLLYPAAQSLLEAKRNKKPLKQGMEEAYEAAHQGMENSRQMKAQHGRAAYYQDGSIGKQDAGATVGLLFIEVFYEYCR